MLMERQAALIGPELAVARDELRGELDNLRAAAEWILAEDDEHVALPVLEAFYTFLWMHSWFDGAETLELLGRTAGFDADDPRSASAVALAAAMYRVAIGARLGYDPAARSSPRAACPSCGRGTWSESSQAACARSASWRCIGTSTQRRWRSPKRGRRSRERSATGSPRAGLSMDLGFARLLLDDLEAAREAFEAAHVLSEKLGNPLLRAYATSKLGLLADAEERYGDAMRLHMEANELFAGVGDVGGAGYALSRASLSAYGTEEYEEALRLGRAGYEAFSEVNHRWGMIAALCRIGFAALALGDVGEAQRTFRAALERAHDSAAISLELLALSGVGAVLRDTGEREQAATVLTFALGHEQLPPSYSVAARPALEALEAELPPEQLAAARLAAAATSLEDLVTQALQPIA